MTAITTSAAPVISTVFSRLKSSSSPSSPTSRKPTEIVMVNTNKAAISTHRLFVIDPTRAPTQSAEPPPRTGPVNPSTATFAQAAVIGFHGDGDSSPPPTAVVGGTTIRVLT